MKIDTVLANGHIRYGETVGSIHQAGRAITNAPCNGWEHWYYVDETTGERAPINRLRQQLINPHTSRGKRDSIGEEQ